MRIAGNFSLLIFWLFQKLKNTSILSIGFSIFYNIYYIWYIICLSIL
jgi:hypothetical protein